MIHPYNSIEVLFKKVKIYFWKFIEIYGNLWGFMGVSDYLLKKTISLFICVRFGTKMYKLHREWFKSVTFCHT
jgi:hypothetical protein